MRVLVEDEWFEPLASHSLLEIEYERLIAQAARKLFPRHRWVDLKIAVESPHGVAKPDFALVEAGLREWWVGEAELAHHSLSGHVLPQVERLATATYGDDIATQIVRQAPDLSETKVRRMMKGAQPRILVVVNEPRDEWQIELAPWAAHLSVVEVLRSERARHALVVSRDLPTPAGAAISVCRISPYLRGMLEVDTPGALPEIPADGVPIRFNGRVSQWTLMEVADQVWLKPESSAPSFDKSAEILLYESANGDLEFRQ